ncbi:MAG: UDP-N-acetylmuramate dehydrogenase [Treponema sp.]|nr:UDP-N-acetylmuramate dehydrogenase [Treponema sp.]
MTSIRQTAEKFNTPHFRGTVTRSENMAHRTTMRVGGAAPLFVEPHDEESLLYALTVFRECDAPYFVLGGGSNVIVSDSGFEGAVISTCKLNDVALESGTPDKSLSHDVPCSAESRPPAIVTCGAGAAVSAVVSFCTEHERAGLESFAGLPGTAGGALYMNARCFDVSASDVLFSADYIDCQTLERATYRCDQADWAYKVSPFQKKHCIITRARFKTRHVPGAQQAIAERCRRFARERSAKGHFKCPSAGSVFKNNRAFGKPSGKIIDECGLKGVQIGGAQIAPWHGNFIINTGNATARDVQQLVEHAQDEVHKQTGFVLEPEIIFCGIW